MAAAKHDTIAVIDFGGQYAHLIATKVRRIGVFSEIRQPEDAIGLFSGYRGIILSGSPALASKGEESDYDKAIYDLDIPIVGFCFGHQEIAKHYGGTVANAGNEWGPADLHLEGEEHPLFRGLGPVERVWMSHNDSVSSLGEGFRALGHTVYGEEGRSHRNAAIADDVRRRYGFQFHPEVDDTVHGDEMIARFVLDICGCTPTWSMESYLEEQVARIRDELGDRSVFLLVSGGVDSTVTARLLGLAVGPVRLHLLHVDNGLMRKDESRQVLRRFRDLGLDHNLHFVDATEDFLGALGDETEPERKRKIIGTTFIEVFEREARRLGIEGHVLGQGTIYPDTIETGGTKRADTIKTHHNRVPLVERMIAEGRVVEPLSELYKVEVRELGVRLGVPEELVGRHPFPGPGLGIRLLCAPAGQDTGEVAALRPAVQRVAGRYGLEGAPLPVRSVGVKADLRTYEHPVLLTGDASWERLQEAAASLFKEVRGVNRCLWNLSPDAPTAFEPLAATMTRGRLDLLREADALVMDALVRHGLYGSVWQCPTVFLPLRVDGRGSELCVLRPIHSERAMTATAAELPRPLLEELAAAIGALPGISGVATDLSPKPPSTVEWE